MFTDADFREYFRQIRMMENQMASLYQQMADALPEGECRDVFSSLVHDEHEHSRFVAEIEKFFIR